MRHGRVPSDADRVFEEVWTDRLAKESEGLDFDDAEDRAIFRGKIFEAVRNASWDALRRISTFLGASKVPRNRDRTVRILVNRWIELRQAPKKTSTQLNREIVEVLGRGDSHSTKKSTGSTLRHLYVLTMHSGKGTKLAELTGERIGGNAVVRLWNASQRKWQKVTHVADYMHGYYVDERPARESDLKRYGFALPAGHYLAS